MIPPAAKSNSIEPASRFNDLLRAVFLAASWTWVIGMFLPVLLVREYGVWAWVIFAVPNCIGAAAMGWTLRTREQSLAMARAHDAACRAFSLVTIAFHVFFAFWILVPWMSWKGWLPGVFVFIFAFLTMRSSGVAIAAVLTYIYSLFCAAFFLAEGGAGIVPADPRPAGELAAALAALVPICVLGFALNPYLDLTFHAARQASDDHGGARLAFGVGFCLLFLAMIGFTLAYSGVLWRDVLASTTQGKPPDSQSPVWFIAGHILFPASVTAGIHAASAVSSRRWAPAWLGLLIAVIVGIGAALWARSTLYRADMLSGELVYRLFMGFYGLIFPAYAWICMTPTWRDPARPTGRQLAVFIVAVVLAAPFFWLGFIGQRMPWAAVGVAIVFLARFVFAFGRREPS